MSKHTLTRKRLAHNTPAFWVVRWKYTKLSSFTALADLLAQSHMEPPVFLGMAGVGESIMQEPSNRTR